MIYLQIFINKNLFFRSIESRNCSCDTRDFTPRGISTGCKWICSLHSWVELIKILQIGCEKDERANPFNKYFYNSRVFHCATFPQSETVASHRTETKRARNASFSFIFHGSFCVSFVPPELQLQIASFSTAAARAFSQVLILFNVKRKQRNPTLHLLSPEILLRCFASIFFFPFRPARSSTNLSLGMLFNRKAM